MLSLINTALLLSNLTAILLSYMRRSVSILLWGVVLVIFTIPHFLYTARGRYSTDTLMTVATFALIFNLLWIVFYTLLSGKRRLNSAKPIFDSFELKTETHLSLYVALYVMAFGVIVLNIVLQGFSLSNYSWGAGFQLSRPVYIVAMYFIMSALGGIGLATLLQRRYWLTAVVIFAFMAYILIERSRYDLVAFILPFLISMIFGKNKRTLIYAGLGMIGVLFFVFFLQQVRYAGSLSNLFANYSIPELIGNTFSFMGAGKGEFGLSRAFYYFAEQNNAFPAFEQGNTYLRLGLIPFPSSLLSIKPRDFAMDMYTPWYRYFSEGGTMHAIIYGDAFANFGFIGVLTAPFYAVLAKFADRLIECAPAVKLRIFYVGVMATMYVLLARGAVYNAIANAVFAVILINLIYLVESRIVWRKGPFIHPNQDALLIDKPISQGETSHD